MQLTDPSPCLSLSTPLTHLHPQLSPPVWYCTTLGDYSLQPTDPSPTSTPSYHHLCGTVLHWVTTHCSQQIHLPPPPPAITTCVLLGDYSLQPTDPSPTSTPSYHHLCVTGWLLTAANRSISHLHHQLSPPVCYWVTTHCSQQIHLPPPPPAITTCVVLYYTGWLLTAANRSISHLHPQLSPPVCYWVTTHCSQQIHLPPPPPAITTCVLHPVQ